MKRKNILIALTLPLVLAAGQVAAIPVYEASAEISATITATEGDDPFDVANLYPEDSFNTETDVVAQTEPYLGDPDFVGDAFAGALATASSNGLEASSEVDGSVSTPEGSAFSSATATAAVDLLYTGVGRLIVRVDLVASTLAVTDIEPPFFEVPELAIASANFTAVVTSPALDQNLLLIDEFLMQPGATYTVTVTATAEGEARAIPEPPAIPEPGVIALLSLGFLGLVLVRRRALRSKDDRHRI